MHFSLINIIVINYHMTLTLMIYSWLNNNNNNIIKTTSIQNSITVYVLKVARLHAYKHH